MTFVGGGYWATTYSLAGAVVSSAEVRVETRPQIVSHPEGGVVAAIHVSEGDSVDAGAPLIAFDQTMQQASLTIYTDELESLGARRARLLAERDNHETIRFPAPLLERAGESTAMRDILDDQRSIFDARRESFAQRLEQIDQRKKQLQQEIEAARANAKATIRNLGIARNQMDRRQKLLDKGYATRDSVDTMARDTAMLEGSIRTDLAAIRGFERQIDETNSQQLQIEEERREGALEELRQTETRMSELRERTVVASDSLRKITVTAPQSGIVQALRVHAPGAVLAPGAEIMTIVDVADRLMLETRVSTNERDRLSLGQRARVRFSTFNQRTTPEIEAIIIRISPDRLIDEATGEPYYDVALLASEEELARLGTENHLTPGMPAELFIATEERTALSYLIKPFTDFMHEAGRER